MDRYTRYSGLIDPDMLKACRVLVVGVGAIGRQALIALTTMGVGHLTFIDFDDVEDVNLGPQGYDASDVGTAKVEATAARLAAINPDAVIHPVNARFRQSRFTSDGYDFVVMAVDCMDARKLIMESIDRDADHVPVVIDCRMGAEQLQVRFIDSIERAEHWMETWVSNADVGDDACTTKSTFHCAMFAGAMVASHVTRWMRGHDVPYCVGYAMLIDDISTDDVPDEGQEDDAT